MRNLKDLGMAGWPVAWIMRVTFIRWTCIHVYEDGSEFDSYNESPRQYQEAKETMNAAPRTEEPCVKDLNIWHTYSASYARSVTIICWTSSVCLPRLQSSVLSRVWKSIWS
jgi:hypothetical protein